jgi:hypothetical protein
MSFVIYLDRLVRTRNVLKDIYTQLDELNDVYSERERLLGETYSASDRSMKWDLGVFMVEIRNLYEKMMVPLMKKGHLLDRLEVVDTKDDIDTVIDMIDSNLTRDDVHDSILLGPKLFSYLNAIAVEICDVLFAYDKNNHFKIHNRSEWYESLCSHVSPKLVIGKAGIAHRADGIQHVLQFYDSIAFNITSMNELEQQYFNRMDLTDVYKTRMTVNENTYIVFGCRIWSPANLHYVIRLKEYATYMRGQM